MSRQLITLINVSREDVSRIQAWLKDDEVADSWFGRYAYGDPAHLGYHPTELIAASDETWDRTFKNPEHRISSIYTAEGDHIGEVHIAVEESLYDGQLSILIGRKDLWHHGYGTSALRATLEMAFKVLGLARIWVDVPEYNVAARNMFRHMGFVHEGTLRKSRPHHGSRFDSVVMGILSEEFIP